MAESERERIAADLVELGVPERRAEIVAAVVEGENKSYPEIGDELGINGRTVSSQVYRYREQREESEQLRKHGYDIERSVGVDGKK